jgi:hypothetical protein
MSRTRPSNLGRGLVSALTTLALIAGVPVVAADSTQDFHRQLRSTSEGFRSPAPPVYRDCDMEFTADQYNDRVDCKTENANVSLYDYIDTVIQFDKMRRSMGREPIFTDSQMEQMLAGRERAQNAKNRSHAAQVFRGTAKKQKSEDEDCYTKEIIGDNKGDDEQPCVAGEDCE